MYTGHPSGDARLECAQPAKPHKPIIISNDTPPRVEWTIGVVLLAMKLNSPFATVATDHPGFHVSG